MSYKSKVAFVVGNGVSRKSIDLNQLAGKAPIYGCNALYRDFDKWDYLVSMDQGMVNEIRRAEIRHGTIIVPPEDKHWEPVEYSPNRRRNNAGMLAMETAIDRKHEIIYCLGFDFILEGEVSVDNVYKNTENYGPETHASRSDNFHRIQYLEWFANKYNHVKIIFVIPDDSPTKPITSDNIYLMNESTFVSKIDH